LFNLGNTAANSRFPMAGDNWMSCNSCHLDGFNFTNRYLMAAHRQQSGDNAINGHANLANMVAGDFIGEYLRMTQQTQGGMGHDTRDGAEAVDPARPQPEVQAMMEDLHAFVTSDGNLPYLANWLRLDAPRRILPRRRPLIPRSGSTPPPARTATNRRSRTGARATTG
jgi:hypothetical protein